MRIPTAVVIPFRGKLEMTERLVRQLAKYGGCDHLHLYNNGPRRPAGAGDYYLDEVEDWCWTLPRELNIDLHHRPYSTITQMWNDGWGWALKQMDHAGETQVNVAFLNNDIEIPPGFLQRLARDLRAHDEAWITYPETTTEPRCDDRGVRVSHGTYRHGGMSGWAFMIKGEAAHHGLPFVDEQFQWWCGDDDLAFSVESWGFQQLECLGLGVVHQGSATAAERPELYEIGQDDLARCQAKWGK